MEYLQIIAQLCHIAVGGMSMDTEKIDKAQLKCQQYYVSCAIKTPNREKTDPSSILAVCVMSRNIE